MAVLKFGVRTVLVLLALCIGHGNSQRYAYELPNMASISRRELNEAGPIIENAVQSALNHVDSLSNSSKNTSGHHGILKNLTRLFEVVFPCKY